MSTNSGQRDLETRTIELLPQILILFDEASFSIAVNIPAPLMSFTSRAQFVAIINLEYLEMSRILIRHIRNEFRQRWTNEAFGTPPSLILSSTYDFSMVSEIDFPAFCKTPISLPNLTRRVKGIARKEHPMASRLQLFSPHLYIIPSNNLDIFSSREFTNTQLSCPCIITSPNPYFVRPPRVISFKTLWLPTPQSSIPMQEMRISVPWERQNLAAI